MKLTERLSDRRETRSTHEVLSGEPSSANEARPNRGITTLKKRLHAALVDKVDLRTLSSLKPESMRKKLTPAVLKTIKQDPEAANLTQDEHALLLRALIDEVVGFGPLEPLLSDTSVSDILVNTYDTIFVERRGKLQRTDAYFDDNDHLLNTIQRIASRVGRRIDESSPMVDARLPDGSRINAAIPPISPDGPLLSIRRFSKSGMTAQDLVRGGAATKRMVQFLAACVRAKCNMVVSGGTGAGKTTMLNLLSSFIPKHERVVTAEDSAELSLQGHHVVRLESRPANIEGHGEITIRDLVRNALRMRPDRIIVGEVRSSEALDMLQAMNTGHEGSMCTIHSNSAREAADRLMMMLALSGVNLSAENMARFVASSVKVIVQLARFPDGARRVTSIAEIVGCEGERVSVHEIFKYTSDPDGKYGRPGFIFDGVTTLNERFAEAGIKIDRERETSE